MLITKGSSVRVKVFSPALMHIFNVLFNINEENVTSFPKDLVITSINDSTSHSAKSKHYEDKAIDLRSKNFNSLQSKLFFQQLVQARLGKKFTVLLENKGKTNEHFHIQVKKGEDYP